VRSASDQPGVLLGAGASIKSGVPAADQLAQRAIRWAWCLEHERHVHGLSYGRTGGRGSSKPWFDEKADLGDLYPVIMERLLGVKDKRREFLQHMIRPTEMAPSKGYEALSYPPEGLITTVLGTNFDQRLEEARTRLRRSHALTVMRTTDDLIRFSTALRAPSFSISTVPSITVRTRISVAKSHVRIPPSSGERGLVRLLNLAFAERLESRSLIVEQDRWRAYFPKDGAGERHFTYQDAYARTREPLQRPARAVKADSS
jgi:hypothetical protein